MANLTNPKNDSSIADEQGSYHFSFKKDYLHLVVSEILLLPASVILENNDGLETVDSFEEYLSEWTGAILASFILGSMLYFLFNFFRLGKRIEGESIWKINRHKKPVKRRYLPFIYYTAYAFSAFVLFIYIWTN